MKSVLHSVKGKLFSVVGLLAGVAIVVGVLGLTKMTGINERLNQIVEVASAKQLSAARSRQALIALHRAEKNLVLSRDTEEMDAFSEQISQYKQELDDHISRLNELATDNNKELIAEFRKSLNEFTDVNKEVRDLSRENSNRKAYLLSSGQGREVFERLEQVMGQLADRNDEEVSQVIDTARDASGDEAIKKQLTAADQAATRALLGARVRANMVALQRAEKNFVLAQDDETMQEYAAVMEDLRKRVNQQVQQIEETATDANRALIAQFSELKEKWLSNNQRVLDLASKNTNGRAYALSAEKGRELLTQAETQLKKIAENAEEAMAADARASDENYKAARLMVILTLVIGVAAGVAVSFVIIRNIVGRITMITGRAKEIADNDLTGEPLPVRSEDELGQLTQATNRMSESLKKMVGEVASSANEVAGAATEIANTSEEMANGTSEQNEQVTQISSAIEEMSSSIDEVAKKSSDAATNADESGKIADEGGQVVQQTVEGMESINEAVSSSAQSVQELGKRGEQIGQIIEVINDIADQTNLLALNAAIEAARAGEHGRGFAVVADEVRKLADRTTKATEEIGESIQAIQEETSGAVNRMNTGTDQVKQGVELATNAGESLKKIVSSAKDVAEMVQSIAAASEQQSSASEEVSRNIDSIKAVTQQTSEGANQAASAASQLSSKAEQLQCLVNEFKLPEQHAA